MRFLIRFFFIVLGMSNGAEREGWSVRFYKLSQDRVGWCGEEVRGRRVRGEAGTHRRLYFNLITPERVFQKIFQTNNFFYFISRTSPGMSARRV